jgi:hypothetical protein
VSVALVIKHIKRKRRITRVLSSEASLALPYFFTLSCKRQGFRKKCYRIKIVSFDVLYSFCLKYLILGRIQQGIINTHTCSCKVPIIPNRFQLNLNFIDGFSKNTQISNLMKIRPVGVKLFRADGQTDELADRQKGRHKQTKLIVAFRNLRTRLKRL